MKKVDFKKIPVKTLQGEDAVADVKFDLANHLYTLGPTVKESALGMKIWQTEGEVELNNEELKIITETVKTWRSYFIRHHVLAVLGVADEE
jgi:hypothetical protein